MKRGLAITLMLLLCAMLAAQSRQLPVVEIMGEGPVKIPLAQRGPLPFLFTAYSDSLPHFVPESLPYIQGYILPFYPRLKGRLDANLRTDWNLGLSAVAYEINPSLPVTRLEMSQELLTRSFDHQYYNAYASIRAAGLVGFDTQIKHHNTDADGYQSSTFLWQFSHHADSLEDRSWIMKRMNTRLWWENSSQLFSGSRAKHSLPGFWHRHRLQAGPHMFENQAGISMGRFALGSVYAVPNSIQGIKNLSAGFMTDFRHLLPLVNLSFEHVINPRLRLTAGNYPALEPGSRTELMESFPWAGQPRIGRVKMCPLDLNLTIEHTLPGLGLTSPTHLDRTPQNQLSVNLRSVYIYNHPVLRQVLLSGIPALFLEPLWSNSLSARASVRLPWGLIDQDLNLEFRHLPHQRYIREPYSGLINSRTRLTYKRDRVTASLSLDQSYNRRDHLGNNLSEIVDINLEAGWQICWNVRISAELTNLFGTKVVLWKGLPQSGRELRLGASYTWR